MGDYKRSGGFGGKSRDGGFKRGGGDNRRGGDRSNYSRGGRDNDRTEMFSAVCATCNKKCEIPFKPSNDRPVYCSDCFQSNREREGGRNEGGRRDSSRDRDSSERYPKNSSSFTPQRDTSEGKQTNELKKQIEITNDKLEQIIQLLRGEVKGSRNTNEEKTLKSIVNEVIASSGNDSKNATKNVPTKKNANKVTPKKVANKVTPKKVTKKVIKKVTNKTNKKAQK